MITNKDKVIQLIADFLSDYIKKTSLNSFWIKSPIDINDKLVLEVCIQARKNCGADIYAPWKTIGNKGNPYIFIKPTEPANKDECLIVSTMCREEGIIDRSFHKHYDYADVYPLLDLYKSEVLQLLELKLDYDYDKEYIAREDCKSGIISSDFFSPMKHPDWYKFTKSQKEVIAKMHARERATRHKDLLSRGAIFPRIRDTEYVR